MLIFCISLAVIHFKVVNGLMANSATESDFFYHLLRNELLPFNFKLEDEDTEGHWNRYFLLQIMEATIKPTI